MKKRLVIGIVVLCVLLVFGHTASANAPVPDPYAAWVDYKNVPEGSTLAICTTDGETLSETVTRTTSGRLTITNPREADLFAVLTLADGTTVSTAPLRFESRSYYRFDGATGTLEPGRYLKSEDTITPILLILGFAALLLALGVTSVIELLVGLCFRLRRVYRVLLINLITNPIMNTLLILTYLIGGDTAYWIALILFEILVCGFEFWFYTAKYKDRKWWVLLLFTLVANAASASAGLLPLWLIRL